MKRFIALMALLLCTVIMLGSCSVGEMSLNRIYRKYSYETAELSNSAELTDIEGYNFFNTTGYLLTLRTKEDKIKFYNAKTSAVVLELDQSTDYTVFSVMGYPFVRATETDAGADTYLRIYDANGNMVVETKDPTSTHVDVFADLFRIDDVIYRVDKKGKVKQVKEDSVDSYVPAIGGKTKKFYYSISSQKVSVYNKDIECVFYWEVPFEGYLTSDIFLLSDGVLLAQVIERLPTDSKKYDYVANGEKYNVISYILNAKSGSVREVNLDFIVASVQCFDMVYGYTASYEEDLLPKKITNIAHVRYIKNERVDKRSVEVIINNNGSTVGLASKLENMPYPVAKNRYVETRYNGEKYLINGRGKVMANLTGETFSTNDKYILVDNRLYDFDLKLVYDAKASDYEVTRLLATSAILMSSETGQIKYYLFNDGNITEIADYDSSYDQYYVTKTDGKYTFYSESGASLLTAEGVSWSAVYISDGSDEMIILVVDSAGNSHYYKLS